MVMKNTKNTTNTINTTNTMCFSKQVLTYLLHTLRNHGIFNKPKCEKQHTVFGLMNKGVSVRLKNTIMKSIYEYS